MVEGESDLKYHLDPMSGHISNVQQLELPPIPKTSETQLRRTWYTSSYTGYPG